jgi:putative transposase
MNEQCTQTVRKTFKYKPKPHLAQEQTMAFVVRRCRALSYADLQERNEAWEKRHLRVTEAMQSAQLPHIKVVRPEYRDINSQVLQDVMPRLDRAFQRRFARVKNGENPRHPRFQGAGSYNSFTYEHYGNGATLDNGFLVHSKIGRSTVRRSRPVEGAPKTVTISREVDGCYVGFSCADAPIQPLPPNGRVTGVDFGLEAVATPSDGTRVFSLGWYRKAERALKTAQRRVSRRRIGSNRWRKADALLAKAHQKVRQDFRHKTALALNQQNDTSYHEALQPANMVQNHLLAKSVSDAGWGAFLIILTYKAACAGRRLVAVNAAYTLQTCSGCGVLVQKGLSVRWRACPNCGTSLHRDHNAAKNRERAGQAVRGVVA